MYWDELTREPVHPDEVWRASRFEIKHFRQMGLYKKAPSSEATEEGDRIFGVRCADVKKRKVGVGADGGRLESKFGAKEALRPMATPRVGDVQKAARIEISLNRVGLCSTFRSVRMMESSMRYQIQVAPGV